ERSWSLPTQPVSNSSSVEVALTMNLLAAANRTQAGRSTFVLRFTALRGIGIVCLANMGTSGNVNKKSPGRGQPGPRPNRSRSILRPLPRPLPPPFRAGHPGTGWLLSRQPRFLAKDRHLTQEIPEKRRTGIPRKASQDTRGPVKLPAYHQAASVPPTHI